MFVFLRAIIQAVYTVFGESGGSSGRAVGYHPRGPGFDSQSGPSQIFIAPRDHPALNGSLCGHHCGACISALEPSQMASGLSSRPCPKGVVTSQPSLHQLHLTSLKQSFCRGGRKQSLAYERGTTRGQKRQKKTKARYFDNVKYWTRKNSTEIFTIIERREDWREMIKGVERATNVSKIDAEHRKKE
ncbi:hypothetical protein PoB_003057300 [Plakobranchus ocellatus]|uniref:Uncharacterized protein n=1 Tax=Plakobranchus ocellatus TaxID=259542 RepID=A0AAV4ABE5_9GAST|nr:hypothetical protein PoB_003057300 [Plakobranchus ocellatus]